MSQSDVNPKRANPLLRLLKYFAFAVGGLCTLFVAVGVIAVATAPHGAPSTAGAPAAPAVVDDHPTSGMKGSLAIDVASATVATSIGPSEADIRAADGGVLVVIYYSVKNVGVEPVHASDIPDLHLVDAKGVQYNEDDGKSGVLSFYKHFDIKGFSDLNPGITVRNAKVFEVSKADFDPRTWSVVFDGVDQHFLVADVARAAG